MENIEAIFLEKIKPFVDRIEKLEKSEQDKDMEIVTLKHAVQNLNRIIENIKSQQPASKATGQSGKPLHNKTNSALPPPLKENKGPKEGEGEEGKGVKTDKKPARPQTANPAGKDKEENKEKTPATKPPKTAATTKDAKDKEEKKKLDADKDKKAPKTVKKTTDKADKAVKSEKALKTEESEKSGDSEKKAENTDLAKAPSEENLEVLKENSGVVNSEVKPEESGNGEKAENAAEEEEVM